MVYAKQMTSNSSKDEEFRTLSYMLSTYQKKMKITHIIAYLSCCYLLSTHAYIFEETDTLLRGQSMSTWNDEHLSSANKIFMLQFFGNNAAGGMYLGIFYHAPSKTRNLLVDDTHPLWVANRDTPIVVDPRGNLELVIDDTDGLLKLKKYSKWSKTISDCSPTTKNTTATILDNGNLVLRMHNPDGSINRTMWQSFDYPTDTLLPGMKLGINFRTGHNSSLTSWKSKDEPASGSFTLGGDPNGTSQLMLWWQGSPYWKSGQWGNGNFNNTNLFGVDFNFEHISNENEKYLMYSQHSIFKLQYVSVDSDGVIHFVGRSASASIRFCSVPEDLDPGCVHAMERLPHCRKDEVEFYESYGLVEGSSYIYDQNKNLSMFDCKAKCRQNCSCIAFTLGNKETMCEIFTKVKFTPSKEHGVLLYSLGKDEARKWWAWIVGAAIGIMLVIILCYFLWKGKDMTEEKMLLQELADTNISPGQYSGLIDKIGKKMKNQVQVFSFQSLEMATDDFSIDNKLGEGGFGSVYKGKLLNGQEVAIKRLSRSSGQGLLEFKNEILLIAKLQHDNLVKLIGCCIKSEEKILVYEFMPNGSLDFFLFDSSRRESIKWTNRINIIQGVAQGLLYLHKYSRLRVIHRDLKASNILLDENMNPKISDFGMAKIFGKQDSEANTKRIVGTHGYMSPEYAIKGIFSAKSDVFSFGVLMLEIVSGKKNHGCYHSERPLNLTGLAWELWVEGRAKELMDTTIIDETSYTNEIIRCINVGLLCVQDNATDRPSMMDVVSMVTNESVLLPIPKQPAFFIGINTGYAATELEIEKPCTNDLSFSAMDGR